ncbi:MAG: glutamate--tRNA ligase [Actinobacteria bacterium]|nr:glutamate--tRNA ligase [Actinomycetota bacterium]
MVENNRVRVRFAPSPTGHLHIGSARTALFNWLFARHNEGDFLLRIEDTDRSRSTLLFEKSIIEQLAWLGLNWDEGPDIGGGYGPYRQSERGELYRAKADDLLRKGLAYNCFCTPDELEESREKQLAAGRPPRYEGTCRDISQAQIERFLAEGRKPTLRFRMPEKKITVSDVLHGEVEFDGSEVGDFIIQRSDGGAGFHFAVVVDDGEMEITHVIRGNDHLPNSVRHVPLFEALGYRAPLFAHFGLIVGEDGAKLSKRHGAVSVFEYREAGYLPEALNNYLALLGWTPPSGEILGLEEVADAFELEKVNKSPVTFERSRLDWFNGRHLRATPPDQVARLAIPFLERAGLPVDDFELVVKAVDAARENSILLVDIPTYARIFLGPFEVQEEAKEELAKGYVPQVLDAFRSLVVATDELDLEGAEGVLASMRESFKPLGIRGRELFHPMRVALTGQNVGPDLIRTIVLLGKDEVFQRLSRSYDLANELLSEESED